MNITLPVIRKSHRQCKTNKKHHLDLVYDRYNERKEIKTSSFWHFVFYFSTKVQIKHFFKVFPHLRSHKNYQFVFLNLSSWNVAICHSRVVCLFLVVMEGLAASIHIDQCIDLLVLKSKWLSSTSLKYIQRLRPPITLKRNHRTVKEDPK